MTPSQSTTRFGKLLANHVREVSLPTPKPFPFLEVVLLGAGALLLGLATL
jgi:hypothetical protein